MKKIIKLFFSMSEKWRHLLNILFEKKYGPTKIKDLSDEIFIEMSFILR